MPPRIKITRPLAGLMVRDLRTLIREAEAEGIKPPDIELPYDDRLSVRSARKLMPWVAREMREALVQASHPAHAGAHALLALSTYFGAEHPQTAGGEPAEWRTELSPALAGLLFGTRQSIEAGELTAAEARDWLIWSNLDPENLAARFDRNSPHHAAVTREFEELHARAAAPEAPPIEAQRDSGGMSRPAAATRDPATQARIDRLTAELRADPLRGSPARQAKAAELERLLTAPTPTPPGAAAAPPPGGATPSPPPAANPVERVAELNRQLRDPNTRGDQRQVALADLETALSTPAAPPAAEGDGGAQP
jgi:hypothetical protein